MIPDPVLPIFDQPLIPQLEFVELPPREWQLPKEGEWARFLFPHAGQDDPQREVVGKILKYQWIGSTSMGVVRMFFREQNTTHYQLTVVNPADGYERVSAPEEDV